MMKWLAQLLLVLLIPVTALADGLAITNATSGSYGLLASATTGVEYSSAVTVTGGTEPYTWSLSNGTLPAGLSLDMSTGIVSGQVASIGSYLPRFTVQDALGATVTKPFILKAANPLAIASTTLASGYVGTNYFETMLTSGGITPLSYSFIGDLPAGLSPTSASISGKTSTAGLYSLSFSVTDSSSPTPVTVSQTVSLRIWDAVAITTTTIPDGIQKAAFSATLSGTGGATPHTWSLPLEKLPQGVSLDGATGTIAGTPLNCGTFPFTARLTDSAATTKDQSLTINITCSNDYLITGNAGVAGATVSYSGPASGTVTADDNGNYSIGPLQHGNYTVIPSKSLTSFDPPNRSANVDYVDVSLEPFAMAFDTAAPTVTGFTVPATATSLTVPVSSLTGTDNAAITGYLITETDSIPSASAGSWSSTRPTGYTFAAGMPDGVATVKAMYAWLKDATGNISESASATTTITLADVTKPVVTAFTVASTASTLIVPVATLAATDNVGVTGYLVTESAAAPAPSASGWSAIAPTSYTVTAAIPAGVPTAKTIYAWSRDASGNVSLSATAITTITITDVTKPQVSFTMPSTAATLTVPVTVSATDNDIVTGYLITENPTTPSAAAVGWRATPPASYSFGVQSSYTLYAWAKDASGNVSESATATITITDVAKPQISAFTMQSPAATLNVPVLTFSATDNDTVAGYLITEYATPAPSASAVGWGATPPATYRIGAQGTYTLYAWAKDASGNVSESATATITITDVTKPEIKTFTMQSPAASLTVPVTALIATDNDAVISGYLITESATAPSATAAGWSVSAPTSYLFSTPGSRTAYAWAKDAAGNVSQGRTATVSISLTGEAACGSSGGKNFAGAPGTGLCASGTATTVVGSGPWSWSCTGGDGGTTANCNAYKPGDCDTLGTVSIAEVQSAINMFLGLKSAELCVDIDGAPGVSISEVQKAINSFLGL